MDKTIKIVLTIITAFATIMLPFAIILYYVDNKETPFLLMWGGLTVFAGVMCLVENVLNHALGLDRR